ncbi:elongin-A [Ciona intestinalis]
MAHLVEYVNKYKGRLSVGNETKVLQRALQKLDEVEMNITLLQETGVGRFVNSLRKDEVVGDYARQIVGKWKHLLTNSPQKSSRSSNQELVYKQNNQYCDDNKEEEYDPTRNWEMDSTTSPQKSYKVSPDGNNEYDPTQNWKMKKNKKKAKQSKDICRNVYKPATKVTQPDAHGNKKVLKYENSLHVDDLDDDEYDPCKPNVKMNKKKMQREESDQSDAEHMEYPDAKTNGFDIKHEVLSDDKEIPSSNIHKKHAKVRNNRDSDMNHDRTSKTKEKYTAKRKSAENDPETSSAKKFKNSEHKHKKKKCKGEDLSFEAFMTMDVAKPKKKKKVAKSKPVIAEKVASSNKVELHLPEIQQTYHPLPRAPFDSPTSEKSLHKMTDALAAELHTQRNTKRMQIYSGAKTAYLPKMLSLFDQCMNVLCNNIDYLDVIGVPYDIIKPVLKRCNVEQLYRLEDSNVYLLEDTDELWEKHAMQDFKSQKPQELESWREMYLRLYDAREAKLTKLTHSIQAKVIKAKPLEKRTKLAYVAMGEAKAPRNVIKAQQKYGTAGKKNFQYPSSSNKGTLNSIKQDVRDIRMSVPVGAITAAQVDNQDSLRAKRQAPRVAPMMAKTLKSINKLRFRR